jgi:hypothetical protein
MFQPWKGAQYDQAGLLLLGESTYSWIEDEVVTHPSPQHACELVQNVLRNFPTNPFMTKLSRALAAEERPNQTQLESTWARVAFTNYIQSSVGLGARIRPTSEMWQEAKGEFASLLDDLRPRNIIVLGKEMWSMMPETSVWLTDDVQGYRLSNGKVAICWALNHPSAGLSWRRLSDIIRFACDRELA